MDKIRWGILATGKIAHKFAQGLQLLPGAVIQAIGSRSAESAKNFADTYRIPNIHTSYESLAADPEVDVIYVATPHPGHKEHSLLCLENGKHVLCEKPFAVNAREAQIMVAKAREKNLFLMEAMWTRFMPANVELRKILQDQVIGEVRMLTADFGFASQFDALSRIYNPDLAGGALLDVGIYPISFAYMVFGQEPVHLSSTASICSTGVDDQSAYLFGYANGALARLSSSVATETSREAVIHGAKGFIRVPLFWKASEIYLQVEGKEGVTYKFPYPGTGLQFQAKEVMDCIREGKTESTIMPLDETLRIMHCLDRIRAQWGMKYPME
ncbi:MAG: Gfo/Idh/MocA family oxidoreductase [Bacteroidia bacterium]|nr:Gfo/Idh/MocA family oxidoreductase [Bacteroidia bacterium]